MALNDNGKRQPPALPDPTKIEMEWIRNLIYYEWCFGKPFRKDIVDPDEQLSHFLTTGIHKKLPPVPMFSTEHYLTELNKREIPPPEKDEAPFRHWVRIGITEEIVPTWAFDEGWYEKEYAESLNEGQ